MNFNHLITERELKTTCRRKNCGSPKWKPVSEAQATAGRNVHFDMVCETCGSRITKFMRFGEYELHEKLLKEEVYRAKSS